MEDSIDDKLAVINFTSNIKLYCLSVVETTFSMKFVEPASFDAYGCL